MNPSQIHNPWRAQLQYHSSIDSTNRLAKDLARAGAPEGTVLLADRQSAGRGRLGRSFYSPEGRGIYLSLILRPNLPVTQLMHLTCAAGVALRQAVYDVTGLHGGLKWINDLVLDKRKVAGILVEQGLVPGTDRVDWAVVGIGINCYHQKEDFPPELREVAASLSMAGARSFTRTQLINALLERLHQVLSSPASTVMDAYRRHCITLGQRVQLLGTEPVEVGTALDVDDQGALLVQTRQGTVTVRAGEVSVRGLYGYIS